MAGEPARPVTSAEIRARLAAVRARLAGGELPTADLPTADLPAGELPTAELAELVDRVGELLDGHDRLADRAAELDTQMAVAAKWVGTLRARVAELERDLGQARSQLDHHKARADRHAARGDDLGCALRDILEAPAGDWGGDSEGAAQVGRAVYYDDLTYQAARAALAEARQEARQAEGEVSSDGG